MGLDKLASLRDGLLRLLQFLQGTVLEALTSALHLFQLFSSFFAFTLGFVELFLAAMVFLVIFVVAAARSVLVAVFVIPSAWIFRVF